MKQTCEIKRVFKVALVAFLLFSFALAFLPVVLKGEIADAVEKSDANAGEIQGYGSLVPLEEVTNSILNGGVVQVYDRSNANNNVRDVSNKNTFRLFAEEGLPEKVDLRNYNGQNRVTSVKSQGTTGTCWSFGANAASETSIANSTNCAYLPDLSAFQVAYFGYNALSTNQAKLQGTEKTQAGEGINWTSDSYRSLFALNLGGSIYQTPSEFFQGVGPSKETDIEFPQTALKNGILESTTQLTEDERRTSLTRLKKWNYLGSVINTKDGVDESGVKNGTIEFDSTNETVLTRIKTELNNGNAVDVVYWGGPSDAQKEPTLDTYFNKETSAQYAASYYRANHAVCIVGYDDTYSKSNFKEGVQPEQDGAFIVKNSWGTSSPYTNEGYFYISYYDRTMASAATFEFETEYYDGENLDSKKEIVDQYDYLSAEWIQPNGIQDARARWYANVYTASEDQMLHSIGTYYCSEGNELKYMVFKLEDGASLPIGDDLNNPLVQGSYTDEYEGFTTIKLETPVELQEGERYAVCFSQRDKDRLFCAPQAMSVTQVDASKKIEGATGALYETNAVINEGESFYLSYATGEWCDLADEDLEGMSAKTGYQYDNYCVKAYASSMEVTVNFNSNCGVDVGSQTVRLGTTIDRPDALENGEYTFAGWFKDASFNEEFDFENEAVTRNMTLHAKWTATINYELNEGKNPETNPQTYTYKIGVKSFAEPTRVGYDFKGWWSKDGSGGDWGEQITGIAEDYSSGNVTIYAKWELHTYSITYNNTKEVDNANVQSFTYLDEITLQGLEKKGYDFKGWWTKDGTSGDDWGTQVEKIPEKTSKDVILYGRWELVKYKINYGNMEGATNSNPETYTIEDDTIRLNLPEKRGYWCHGWYTKNGGTSSVASDWGEVRATIEAGSTGDVTIYARWYVENYTISFSGLEGAKNLNENKIYYNITTPKTELKEATKEGYYFLGWFDKAGNQVKEYGGGELGNIELTATWKEIPKYKVIFVDWNGETLKTEVVYENKSATAPEKNPEREGHTFVGWDKDFSSVTQEMIVTARYEINKYEVKFVDWDGTELKTEIVEWGKSATAPEKDPERERYIFTGWKPEDFSVITQNTTIEAQYVVAYRVRFYSYDGLEILKEEWVEVGRDATPPKPPERRGYEFIGWNEEYTNVTADVNAVAKYERNEFTVIFRDDDQETALKVESVKKGGDATPPEVKDKEDRKFVGWDREFSNVTEDIVVTAQYEINVYDVTFVDWNGNVLITDNVRHGDSATPPEENPKREGYTFTGWSENFSQVTKNMTVTAQYKINTYVVTFVDWDGSLIDVKTVEHGATALAPIQPSRTGWTFVKWDKDLTNVTQAMTVTAQYERNKYVVKFVDWDGTMLKNYDVEYEASASAPENPSKEGYTFIGWDRDFSYVTQNMTVTAQYKINTYVVTFVDWDGSLIDEKTVEHGSTAQAPSEPLRTGWTFVGWDKDLTNVTQAMTVTAQYEINVYDVTFVDWNGAVLKTEDVEYGGSTTAPEKPTREGYTFTGWDKEFSYVTDNIVVTAQYTINVYNVTFNSNGGSAVASQKVEYGSKVKEVTEPTKVGYTFNGWFTDSAFKTAFNFNTSITKDTALWAKWTLKVTMFRMYNPNSGEHFYTSDADERDHLKKVGWTYEGYAWNAPATSNTPVYRLYNPNGGDHHYTISASERDYLKKVGWKYEGTGWYSDDAKAVTIYRQYNPNAKTGSHNFTTSTDERDSLVKKGWRDEGIAWYGVK